MLNQLGDDRDHAFLDLPTTDSSDYGWGKGEPRPVYPCTGKPQGLFANKNRSTGFASTAGKYASAFALGAQLFADRGPGFARRLGDRATVAYEIGRARPGVCQTAPGRAPYFYEEDNWADDMELGATQLLPAHASVLPRRGQLPSPRRSTDPQQYFPLTGLREPIQQRRPQEDNRAHDHVGTRGAGPWMDR